MGRCRRPSKRGEFPTGLVAGVASGFSRGGKRHAREEDDDRQPNCRLDDRADELRLIIIDVLVFLVYVLHFNVLFDFVVLLWRLRGRQDGSQQLRKLWSRLSGRDVRGFSLPADYARIRAT